MLRSDTHSMIPPGVQRGEPPAFYKLDEYTFQNLCADLLAATRKEIETCDVYGERGDHQDGIDIRAYLENDDGNVIGQWLGQCKCYKNFVSAQKSRGVLLRGTSMELSTTRTNMACV